MNRNSALLLLAGVAAAWLAGCDSPPQPPGKVNCRLARNQVLYADQERTGDTVVLAKCVRADMYRELTKGSQSGRWYRVICKVEKTERGDWDDENVTFICREIVPAGSTPPPLPYRTGAEFMFYMNTERKPPIIVGQKRLVAVH